MMFKWLDGREAAHVGEELADQFAPAPSRAGGSVRDEKIAAKRQKSALEELLLRADRDVRSLELNFYKKARLANSFKWRLIENGVEPDEANAVTQSLILHLAQDEAGAAAQTSAPGNRAGDADPLLARAHAAFAAADWARAAEFYAEFVAQHPDRSDALNSLGVALCNLGRYQEAEQRYREAIDVNPEYAEALSNLAGLRQGSPQEAEPLLRRVLKINPKFPGARAMLGLMLASAGRDHEAKTALRKALKISPKDANALLGLSQIARSDGQFDEAESLLRRALQLNPKLPAAWAALSSSRKMSAADADWYTTAEEIAGGASLWEASDLYFAMGKYCDDVQDYDRAFANYRRGNELMKSVAGAYDRQGHARFADDMIRVHTAQVMASLSAGGSGSAKPIFVLGMPRSGTSLTEQIIASHPAAGGAGELDFWLQAARTHHNEIRQHILPVSARSKLAEDYLQLIERRFPDSQRIVDKSPTNADFVGFIVSVFPNARIIRMRRDPIDTCLSCYFQHFSTSQRFTMDLSDLADYYRTHQRLMTHWLSVLPAKTILEVPYEELVADQEVWTRRILEFVGLEWDARCLSFHETKRSVSTSSAWQVRQKIYRQSVQRWRNYEKFIGPLKELRE